MVSLKNKQSGFTLVELLIVIVVIGILAALVITTFAGVQQRARNSERQTDINAIAGQLEAHYATAGEYPALTDINTRVSGTAVTGMENFRLDAEALKDPQDGAPTTLVAGAAKGAVPTAPENGYMYWTDGEAYSVSAKYEGDGDYVKQSN